LRRDEPYGTSVAALSPNLVAALFIVLLGWLSPGSRYAALSKASGKLGLDRLMAGCGCQQDAQAHRHQRRRCRRFIAASSSWSCVADLYRSPRRKSFGLCQGIQPRWMPLRSYLPKGWGAAVDFCLPACCYRIWGKRRGCAAQQRALVRITPIGLGSVSGFLLVIHYRCLWLSASYRLKQAPAQYG